MSKAPGSRARAKTGVLVVDKSPIFRQGMASLLERQEDLCCCGELATLVEVPKAINGWKPGLVLLELRAQEADGLESIKGLKARFPQLRLLVLSELDETVYAERALRAGALGYLMKDQGFEEVLRAIRTVLRDELYVSPAISRMAVKRFIEQRTARGQDNLDRLTDRELHVFRAIGAAKANKQIAEEMNLSVKTVETYREHIKYKLGLPNGAKLAEYARNWRWEREK